MPELPEVETIKLGLQKYLVGHTIVEVDVRLPKMLSGNPDTIIGAKVADIRRFGKGLVIDLANDFSIAVHVKMTGQLIYEREDIQVKRHPVKVGKLPGPFTHVIFHLDPPAGRAGKNAKLFYNDIRQFGWLKIVKTKDIAEIPFFKDLGPEPFKELTPERFSAILSKARLPIKLLLMDQKKIAGIGNIYANDALYLACIHPKRPSNSLSAEEQQSLLAAIEQVLRKGIEVGGASEWQYVNALGTTGSYQNFFKVYGKVGKPCPRCGTKIEKIVLGGRGTFFCPKCQN